MVRTLATAATLLALLGLAPAHAQAPNWEKIRIGVEGNYPPFSKMTPDGKFEGFDIEIALAICAEIKAQCTLINQEWDGMMPALNARKFDLIVASMSITDERKKVIDFTDKYYNTPSRIVVKADTAFTDLASLKGKKIGVLKGSTQEKYAMGELKPVGVVVTPYEAQDQVYLDIKSGRLDGTVADSVEVTGGFLSKPEGQGYGFVGPVLNDVKYFGYGAGVALRQGEDALKTELNEAIKAIRANGVYDTVMKKYFSFDVYGG